MRDLTDDLKALRARLTEAEGYLKLDELRAKRPLLEAEASRPDLWDDPDERIREVQDATTEVSEQLVANIKQLNARRGLHFQVSLDGLMGRRKELRDWERAFGSASGDEPAASV